MNLYSQKNSTYGSLRQHLLRVMEATLNQIFIANNNWTYNEFI
jgi:hypothetical protein